MQISKIFLIVGAVVGCALAVMVHAQDTDAQAKAREALRKAMEAQGQPAAAPAPTAPAAPKAPAAPRTTAPKQKAQLNAPPPADPQTIEKAREAVRQRMNEIGSQPEPVPPAAPAAPAPPAPAPVPPAPVVAQPAPAPAPAPPVQAAPVPAAKPTRPAEQLAPAPILTPSEDSEAIAKAREALRQKMSELEGQPSVPVAPAVPAPAPVAPPIAQPTPAAPAAVQPAPVPQVVAPAAPAPLFTAPPAADPEAIAKAREALRQKMTELEAQEPATAPVVAQPKPAAAPKTMAKAPERPVVAPPTPAPPAAERITPEPSVAPPALEPDQRVKKVKPAGPKTVPTFPVLQGPALPISPEKKQQLDDLLRRYKADELTPEQYHAERARILAAP